MTNHIDQTLRSAAFFSGLRDNQLAIIRAGTEIRTFSSGQYIARENDPADYFYLILSGQVAIETHHPGSPARPLLTLGKQAIVGWSWLFEPYLWHYDVRAVSAVCSLQFDGVHLRDSCAQNPVLGYELMRRFAQVMSSRLHATRLQLLNMYAPPKAVHQLSRMR